MRLTAALAILLIPLSASALEVPVATPAPGMTPGFHTSVRVATDGNQYVAAFIEWTPSSDRPQLRLARVSLVEGPLDGEGIVLADGIDRPPAILFDGQSYLLAWAKTYQQPCEVRLARFDQELNPLSDLVVTTACAPDVALATNGVSSLLVWSEGGSIRALTIARDGSLSQPVVVSDEHADKGLLAADVVAAWSGDRWLTGWALTCILCSPPPPAPYGLYVVRLDEGLNLLDPEPVEIAGEYMASVDVAGNGINFLVAWADHQGAIRGSWLPLDGAPNPPQPITEGRGVDLAVRNGEYLLGSEHNGDLYYLSQSHAGARFIAAHAGEESGVQLVVSDGVLAAGYLRERAFITLVTSSPRKRAVGR